MIIDELTPENLRNPKVFERIEELADSFVLHMDAKEAFLFQEKLRPLLESSKLQNLQSELYKRYKKLIAELEWTAFSMLPDEQAMKLLKENYFSVLENQDIDTQNRIEIKMFSVDLFPRNEIRQKMQRALKENTERVGNRTLGEWILDYSKTFDFRQRTDLSPSEFIRKNSQAQLLAEPEKIKLRKTLQIFDKTLLVTPVMSEPAFSMTVREMIKAGTIKETVNPALLQKFHISVPTKSVPIKSTPKPQAPTLKPKKEHKPGLFKKLLGKRPEKPAAPQLRGAAEGEPSQGLEPRPEDSGREKIKKEIRPRLIRPEPKKTFKTSGLSPYEKEREILPTPPKPVVEKLKAQELEVPKKPTEQTSDYQIRTMKQDIEKVKKRPIPEKPKPKTRDNVVDLSKK